MDIYERIPLIITELYSKVKELENLFPDRKFSLDGHLVGSIGEVIAAHLYGLELLPASAEGHDARSAGGRLVQIKATQRDRVGIRSKPDYLIVLRLTDSGEVEEIFNGPGAIAWKYAGRIQKNGQRYISLPKLRTLMEQVNPKERLKSKVN